MWLNLVECRTCLVLRCPASAVGVVFADFLLTLADQVHPPVALDSWRTVKPSRKLQWFESTTRHTLCVRPLTSGNAGQGPLSLVRPSPAKSGCLRPFTGT